MNNHDPGAASAGNRLDTRALPAPEKVMDRYARIAFVLALVVLSFG